MATELSGFNKEILIEITKTPMPFGKFKNTLLCDLPMFYLEWFKRTGFPKGKLGIMIETVYEIKLNGLEEIIRKIKSM